MKKKIANFYSEETLFDALKKKQQLNLLTFQLTSRCNNNCRHCNVNLPANQGAIKEKELSCAQIKGLIDQASGQGALFGCFTGGEPLLREDFSELYAYLRQKGLLPCILTNATLIDKRIIRLFKKYPPRNIEVTVYGVTKETYEQVTRVPGSFERFWRGIHLLIENKFNLELKSMVLSSNLHEMPEIKKFCLENGNTDFFRADPFLFRRLDGNKLRNEEISLERLSSQKVLEWEERYWPGCAGWVKDNYCSGIGNKDLVRKPFFPCLKDRIEYVVSSDGFLHFCQYLRDPDYCFDLKKESLKDAVEKLSFKIEEAAQMDRSHWGECGSCRVENFCLRCPGRLYLEAGSLNSPAQYLCEIAHARAKAYGFKF